MTLLDRQFETTTQGYKLTRVDKLAEHTVRTRVYRDFYPAQSHAIVEVLTPELTWTDLASSEPSRWHDSLPSHVSSNLSDALLDDIAAQLLQRAATILGVAPSGANSTRRSRN
ncbi:hypothetical protein AB0M43_14480 [Longispora sp. NPDC051575]|uniref:hypothetical protein n=1 Tax=Longispora sp. NPDC051575 TaxID=3154943 RepID=UPI003437D116